MEPRLYSTAVLFLDRSSPSNAFLLWLCHHFEVDWLSKWCEILTL